MAQILETVLKQIKLKYPQIIIDLVDDIHEAINMEDFDLNMAAAFSYQISVLLEVMDPNLVIPTDYLKKLKGALDTWEEPE